MKRTRTVKTARTIEEINSAIKQRKTLLFEPVWPSRKIMQGREFFFDNEKGSVVEVWDIRARMGLDEKRYRSVGYVESYPELPKLSYAAYILPEDLQKNETVILEDVIKDMVGLTTNQGAAYRLKKVRAVWTGKKFKIDYSPEKNIQIIIG